MKHLRTLKSIFEKYKFQAKDMKTVYWVALALVTILVIIYFLGPKPIKPKYDNKLPTLPPDLHRLQEKIKEEESERPIREDNQARIQFYHSSKTKTDYSVVYLHGFGGSYRDGYPVNAMIAKRLGANIYYNRMPGHGLAKPHSLDDFSAKSAWEDAKRALSIGKLIGNKVIIMSTSTGGTLALKLATEFPEAVFALINMSPNYEDDQTGAALLGSHWGYEIADLISFGKNREIEQEEDEAKQYWDTSYNSRALVDLQILVETTMTSETFKKVTVPILTLYYSDNEFQEDNHVEVDKYREINKQFSTPENLNILKRLETQETHFIGSDIKSEDIESVVKEIVEFLEIKLNIKTQPISKNQEYY